jgi:tRNA (guanine-N1)-methyltransferase
MDIAVPQVLREGNHRKIKDWAQQQAAQLTRSRRPDLDKQKG